MNPLLEEWVELLNNQIVFLCMEILSQQDCCDFVLVWQL
jgi:hypothetical protein